MYPGHWSKLFPEKLAVVNTETGATLTYQELDDRSNQLAQYFWDQGLRKEDHVAIFMENNIVLFEVIWAVMRSGLYLTTVNQYLTAEEAGYIVNDCGAQVLISSNALHDIAKDIGQYAPDCRLTLNIDGPTDTFAGYRETIAAYPATPLEQQPRGAFMLYSSGTTGRPKGILRPLTGKAIDEGEDTLSLIQKGLWAFGEDTRYLSPAPLYHSAPVGFCTAAQACGGTVYMMPKFDPVEALSNIEKYEITHSQWVPTMFSRMLKLPEDVRTQFDLSSQKYAIHAAAPCPRPVKEQMLDWWGDIIYEYYAGTELNGFTHITPGAWRDKPGTVGQPILGVPKICDEDGTQLPNGKEGIVYFEMPEMPFKYHGDDSRTKEAQHPEHDNWSTLGDVGYVDDDGYLFLTDRATFMIISGGVNIYPQEIEDAMIMHPKVADVAVIGVPNTDMGEEVKAVVQLAGGTAPGEDVEQELLAYTRDHIAHFKCPKSVDFEAELPRLPTGKLYKRILKDRYWGKTDSRIV